MHTLLQQFLDPAVSSLKVCGVTLRTDAEQLVAHRVPALGVNFWPRSKRYCPPAEATVFLPALKDRILRVGVFVNADPEEVARLFEEDLIDLAQFHGDETEGDCMTFATRGLPFIKALGVKSPEDLESATGYHASAILLDAYAPGIYGGTGQTIDWTTARAFRDQHPALPLILAGGITPDNAAAALDAVHPAALDVASGSESEPGIKDFHKVAALLAACQT
jgi:phosphoribosylanthranilate isomerase